MSEKREILFRGKRVDNGEWIEGWFLPGNERQSLHPCIFVYLAETQNFECFDIDIDTLGEYTGVKDKNDKNDKKIFEHDIVRIAVGGIYANHVVSYDKENARFVVGDIDFTMVRIFSPKIEVIGNIHDNPELLEGDD